MKELVEIVGIVSDGGVGMELQIVIVNQEEEFIIQIDQCKDGEEKMEIIIQRVEDFVDLGDVIVEVIEDLQIKIILILEVDVIFIDQVVLFCSLFIVVRDR